MMIKPTVHWQVGTRSQSHNKFSKQTNNSTLKFDQSEQLKQPRDFYGQFNWSDFRVENFFMSLTPGSTKKEKVSYQSIR